MVTMDDFGLGDWPLGGISRIHAIHVAYLRAVRRAGGQLYEYVSAAEVAKRDRWACRECEKPVPRRWTADELSQAPVLAFTVPLAEGGRYAKANVRLVHLGCARFADAALELAIRRTLTGVPTVKTKASGKDTHCINGHELAGGNLLKSSDGRRRCRQCRKDREMEGAGSHA
jgi:hypothetical protein